MPGILVVEDDENLNRGITFSLKKSGYEVFSAESVKKAKRIASDDNVDVAICDVNLPDGNGLDLVRWIQLDQKTLPIMDTIISAVNRTYPKAAEKGMELIFDCNESLEHCALMQDKHWLGEAIINVLDNGTRKFLDRESRVIFIIRSLGFYSYDGYYLATIIEELFREAINSRSLEYKSVESIEYHPIPPSEFKESCP